MTETLIERIQRHEGFCETAKVDVSPMMVIGFGHDITSKQAANDYANGITYDEAMNLLEADIAKCTDQACNYIVGFEELDPIRQDVLLEMIFQLGINGVLAFRNMLTAIVNGDWSKAGYEMVNSKWHSETTARCDELAHIMLTGTY